MRYTLIRTEGDQSFELRGGPLVVGRAQSSDLPVFDPTISRRHAEMACVDGGVQVRDLGSSNGTFVNGDKVHVAILAPGDVVTFGEVSFRLKESSAPLRISPVPPATPRSAEARAEGGTIVRRLAVRSSTQGLAAALRGGARAGEGAASSRVEKSQQKLALLLEVSKGLTRAADVDALLEKVARFVFEILDVDRVSILLLGARGELTPKISRDRQGSDAGRTVPQSIARTAVQDQVAILTDNASEDHRFGGESVVIQRVRSAICAPLIGSEGRVLGVLYVDNLTAIDSFGEEDLEFLVAFAGIAAVAIENSQFSERIRHEAVVRSNFERFFAPALAARIADSPDAARLGGTKCQVAVLFSDIRGFTALSEAMRPDEIASLLTEYFTEMVECVFRNGGSLDKFIGDAVMAQWGAPIGTSEDADRAMCAALEMVHALEALNRKWRGQGRPELQIGIGLNYGEVFAGNIGSERRLEFTVIGDTVNTASRLCSAADAGEILLSEEMRRALRAPPPMRERARMELKGKSQAVPIYSVAL